MLKRYKSSSQQREREVFACMVHNLFDEYRFFPKYPPKELNITAVLFGQLIHHQLVSSITLGIALRYVLDALKKPLDSVMFKFGLSAIHQFKNELAAWPAYCGNVLAEPHVREADPELVAFIERCMESRERDTDAGGSVGPSAATPGSGSAASGLNTAASGPSGATFPNSGRAALDQPNGVQTPEVAHDSVGPSPQAGVLGLPNQADAGRGSGPTGGSRGAEPVQMNGMQQPQAPPAAQPLPEPPAEAARAQPSAQSYENGTKPQTTSTPQHSAPNTGSSTPSLATINAETLESAAAQYCDFPVPPEKNRDRFIFLLNNLSAQNIAEKVAQVEEFLEDDYLQWSANYLVVKRAAQEPNFHVLYVKLLDQLDNKKLLEFIVRTTHHYVKVLLDSERIKTEMSDRSLLKNLGSWLGQLTLGKNRPLRQKDLDLKAIIYEAYERGKMVAVIPFVHKVLEPGKESKVYGPNNPWIKSILALLAEIYTLEGLKMNLTFEIEMIFKDYNLSLGDIAASKGLEEYQRETINNGDFYEKKAPQPPQPAVEQKPMQPVGPPDVSSLNPLMDPVYTGGQTSSQQQIMSMQNLRQGPVEASDMAPLMAASVPRPVVSPFGPMPPAPSPVTGAGGQIAGTDAASLLGQLAGTLHQLVTINPSLSAIADRVPLKRLISVGIDRAIYEIITPVVERSVMIACTTTKELVTKDFAMEPDESKLRRSAHLMVSSLAGSLALVTCKEPLKVSLQSQLKSVLQSVLDPSILEQTINIVINDNLDLGCTIIERASTDKAIKEVDERLLPFYQSRQKARAAGTPFYDMSIFTKGGGRFPASLPDSLRPRPGHLNPQQTRVYDDFARIPRAGNSNVLRMSGMESSGQLQMSSTADQYAMMQPDKPASLAESYALWQQRIDAVISKEAAQNQSDFSQLPETSEVHHLLAELVELVAQCPNRDEVVSGIAEKIFLHMYDRQHRLHTSVLAAALALLRTSGFNRLPSSVTSWFCQVSQDEARRFNQPVAGGLIRANLMVFPELDLHLARCLGSGLSAPMTGCVEFVLYLVKQFVMGEGIVRASELASTLDLLRKLALRSPDGDQILHLIDQVRVFPKDSDPDGLRDQVAGMFDSWATVVHSDPTDAKIKACVEAFMKAGLLKGDDVTGRFFRICAELSVLHCVNTEVANAQGQKPGDGRMSFVMIDAFVKLVVTLLEVIRGGVPGLRKVLEIIVQVLYSDHDERGTLYNSRPYFRIFYGLFQELLPQDISELPSVDTIAALACALVSCRPQRMPGFTFSWLELVSHRTFMARLLKLPDRQGWPYFRSLFMGLLLFMQPYLRHAELGDTLRLLYRGVMRVMLVLLHDFPEFLCDYHVELCNVIPPSCVQMRNLILSAFPSHMRLPDPFTPNLKVDLLADINKEPNVFPEVSSLLPAELKLGVDQYIKTRSPTGFLDELPQRLMLSQDVAKLEGTSYNVTLMNSVVLYTGILAIRYVQNKPGASLVQYGPAMDIFHKLANDLDTEGRYLFLNAIANQLRFPNSHTHYFSCVLLVLFLEAQQRVLQEQITRVLLERLIVHRPHPWGLLITFIELIKNKRYRFWELGITRCAPEIEHLFESVARSCLPQAPDDMLHQDIAVASAVRALE
ncbi:unnamed protein product [Ostreobium quekettii]|uniref:Uncharacterized protein n=1 Tax=Ostreobium quekettii TaxID=121088 RepID=A0A8S1IYB8_9CHLO|nr:unnamed protein product [Ostreobium quekettii]